MRHKTSLRDNQQGLVSLIVTMIIMIVLSLIVLGFAQIARREQRVALDHQLSTQATYAAESGINDAKRAIFDTTTANPALNPYNAAGGSHNKDLCAPRSGSGFLTGTSNIISGNVSYSCLLINQRLHNQILQNVSTNHSTLVPANAVDSSGGAVNLGKLHFSWQAKDAAAQQVSGAATGAGALPSVTAWNSGGDHVGILRIDIVPLSDLRRTALTDNQYTVFLYPKAAPGSSPAISYTNNPNSQGNIEETNCNSSGGAYFCNADINLPNGSNFMVRIRSIYSNSTVQVSPTSPNVFFQGGQIEIDATGRAQDVLKRIKVRAKAPDNSSTNSFPDFALDVAGGICKQLITAPAPTTTQDLCVGGGPTPIPPPVPGSPSGSPGGGSALGGAAFTSACDPAAPTCVPFDPAASSVDYRWAQTFWNNSNNYSGVPTGNCTWNFGDGSIVQNRSCDNGQSITHQYPILDSPLRCIIYTVTLTRTFTNAPNATYTQTRNVPSGNVGPEACANQGGYQRP